MMLTLWKESLYFRSYKLRKIRVLFPCTYWPIATLPDDHFCEKSRFAYPHVNPQCSFFPLSCLGTAEFVWQDETNVHWLLCANTKINLASLSGVQVPSVWHCWWISQAAAASGLSLKQTSGIPAIPEYRVTEYLIPPEFLYIGWLKIFFAIWFQLALELFVCKSLTAALCIGNISSSCMREQLIFFTVSNRK